MYKMIKLDWISMKYYHLRILILIPYLIFMGWFSPISLVPLSVILMFAYAVNPFAVEEKGDLNRLYLSLPVKRSAVVAGRYLLALLLFLAGLAAGFGMMPLANLISHSKWYPDLLWCLTLAAFSFLVHGLMSLAMYPMLFWLGYQKGKLWGFYLPGILIAIAYVILIEADRFFADGTLISRVLVYAAGHPLTICGGMFLLGLAFLTCSFLLSLRIYSRKEF